MMLGSPTCTVVCYGRNNRNTYNKWGKRTGRMARQNASDTVQVRVSREQRELLNLLKSSGESYADALSTLVDSDPTEYSAEREIAEQRGSEA